MKSRFFTLKDSHHERTLFSSRILIVAIIMGILTSLLIARLAYLQVYQHQLYTTLARQNLLNLLPAEPNRGLIYDRNGMLLADNTPVFDLVLIPNRVPDVRTTLTELQKVLPISDEDLQQFNRQLKLQRPFAPIVIRNQLSEEEVARFSVQQYRFPGVTIEAQMVRHYPQGSAFAQVVGYVGRINAKELEEVDPGNYSATNFIGKTGVEKFYESQLHGIVGYQQAEMDANGRTVRVLNTTAPTPGDNLYLTIDGKLQLAAEQVLGDQRGAIVAIDPRNGDVLTLVSNPSYDPNLFVTGISKKDYQALAQAPGQPLYNRVLQGRYPPGSTIKPFVGLEGLVSGIVTADDSVWCPGWYKLKNSSHVYHDWQRRGHGTVNLSRAITESCDTYFYTLSSKLGIDRLDSGMKLFGFGQPTGIDLDNEASGLLPTPEWKQRTQHKPWYPGDTLITGIGQGYMLATPLQLAVATATLAMHGIHIQPHVLLRSQTANRTFTIVKPTILGSVPFDAHNWDIIVAGMENVAKSSSGTGYKYFQNTPYTLAAKTGTAQVFSLKENQKDKAALLPEKLRDNSLFIAFAPADNPRIAIAVMLQNSSVTAASMAKQVLDAYFSSKK